MEEKILEKKNDNEDFFVGNYNLIYIVIKILKKNYNLYIRSFGKLVKIKLKTPKLKIPFGVEDYMNQKILNIEFTKLESNNQVYNFYNTIKNLDSFFTKMSSYSEDNKKIDLKFVSPDFIDKIKGKTYMSCIKERPKPFDPLLRTYLKQVKNNILTKFLDNNKNLVFYNEIKNKYGNFILEVSGLWIREDKFGLIINVSTGILHELNNNT